MEDTINAIPRTLVIDFSSNFGGANARILALIKKFPTTHIGLATITESKIAGELESLGYPVYRIADRKFDIKIPFSLYQVVRENNYQVLDTQNPQSKLWGSIVAFFSGTSLISTLNSFYMNEHPKFSLRWFLYTFLEFVTNFSLSRYIVVSQEIQTALIKMNVSKEKIDLISNAVEIDPSSIHGSRNWILEKFKLPENAVICLAAGRLVWAKAHDDLILAISRARTKKDNLYCLIAGEGSLNDELVSLILELKLEKYVFMLGHVEHAELLSLLSYSDIYVMPSRTEGTPVALLEAGLLGKPIIATNVGGIPELVTNEESALLVNKGSIDALAEALIRVASDRQLAIQLGQQAQKRIRESFSLDIQANLTALSYIRSI